MVFILSTFIFAGIGPLPLIPHNAFTSIRIEQMSIGTTNQLSLGTGSIAHPISSWIPEVTNGHIYIFGITSGHVVVVRITSQDTGECASDDSQEDN